MRRAVESPAMRCIPPSLFPTLAAGVLVVLATAAVGCRTTTSDDDIVPVNLERVRALLEEGDERVFLLDVRSSRRFEQGHIPGAINIPLPELQRRDARLAGADRIIVYGEDGHSGLGAAATKRLIELRYRNAFHFRGGLATWRAQGGELARPTDTTGEAADTADTAQAQDEADG